MGCSENTGPPPAPPEQTSIVSDDVPLYGYRVVNTFPHDPTAFTQGLVYTDGVLLEGTGIRGRSTLRVVDLVSGEVQRSKPLDPSYFGEGIALVEDRIVQLTLSAMIALVYDRDTLEQVDEFTYSTPGWGLTYDGTSLIRSDGSDKLYFLDPESYEETHEIAVRDGPNPVFSLNELEYIRGRIFANIWGWDRIAVIDPETGVVTNWIDLARLLPNECRSSDTNVLNGIAFDEWHGRLFVTGKRWPKLFEIELVPAEPDPL